MDGLTDNELMVIIGTLNHLVTGTNKPEVCEGGKPDDALLGEEDTQITHRSNQGVWQCRFRDLQSKLLQEAIKRKAMKLPPCFTGKL